MIQGGFSKFGDLQVGLAIVYAESGGNTQAKHVNGDGSIDRGLWQINNKAHPDVTDQCAYDPVCSSKFAHQLFSGHGNSWQSWATFTGGSYQKFLPRAQSDFNAWVNGLPGPNVQVGIAAPPGLVGALGAATVAGSAGGSGGLGLPSFGTFFLGSSSGIKRILYVVGGIILAIIGLLMLSRDLTIGAAASVVAKSIVPKKEG